MVPVVETNNKILIEVKTAKYRELYFAVFKLFIIIIRSIMIIT